MKANEMPEKIYVVDATFPDYVDFDGSPINTKRIDDHDIEYIRTDAFIEKAAQWLKENLLNHTYAYKGEVGIGMAVFLEQFKKYMEGE